MEATVLDTALGSVSTALTAAAGSVAGIVPEIVAAGLGIALITFGVGFAKRLFKGTAR